MYGKSLEKKNFDWKEATTLFAMADLYCMDDLKDVTVPLIEPLLSLGNILETAELAVKHNCEKLKEVSCDFALSRIPPDDQHDDLSEKLLLVLPMLGARALKSTRVASKNLNWFVTPFKRRKDFASANSYADYIRQHLKPNMLVMSNQETYWSDWLDLNGCLVPDGCVGRVISCENQQPLVKWNIQGEIRQLTGKFDYLDILTLPIKCDLIVP